MKRRLSYNETKLLIDRGILGVKTSYVCIDGLSKYNGDEYEIRDIIVGDKDIIIKVSHINDNKILITSHKYIKEISRMGIEEILKAYDLLENETIVIDSVTDVINTVIGQTNAKIENYDLEDGMKFLLNKDVSIKYCNKVLTVKGVGDSIKLIANRGRPKKIRD